MWRFLKRTNHKRVLKRNINNISLNSNQKSNNILNIWHACKHMFNLIKTSKLRNCEKVVYDNLCEYNKNTIKGPFHKKMKISLYILTIKCYTLFVPFINVFVACQSWYQNLYITETKKWQLVVCDIILCMHTILEWPNLVRLYYEIEKLI